MNGFERFGEAMICANEGNLEISRALAASVSRLFESLRGWMKGMPTSLPPTESYVRK